MVIIFIILIFFITKEFVMFNQEFLVISGLTTIFTLIVIFMQLAIKKMLHNYATTIQHNFSHKLNLAKQIIDHKLEQHSINLAALENGIPAFLSECEYLLHHFLENSANLINEIDDASNLQNITDILFNNELNDVAEHLISVDEFNEFDKIEEFEGLELDFERE